MFYVRDYKGGVTGPFSLQDLERMVKTRRIARHNKVSEDRVTWHVAAEHPVVQSIFGVADTVPPEPPAEPAGGSQQPVVAVPPQPVSPPPPPASSASGTALLVAAMGAALAALGVLAWLALPTFLPDGSTDAGVRRGIGPSLVTVQGLHPREGKKRCYAIVVSRTLAVAPLLAATLDAVKVEARHGDGDAEWHSAQLLTADPVAGLCVLRADFGRDVKVVDLPEKKSVPEKRATLRLMTADPSGDCDIDRGALAKILDEDEPDERLQVDVDDPVGENDPIGRTVVDAQGRVVGMEVARMSRTTSLCASAHEIRAKKKEAAKLPPDHRLDRIDLPEPPVAGQGQPQQGQPQPNQPPPSEPTPSQPTPSEPPPSQPTAEGPADKPADQGRDVGTKDGRGDKKKKSGGSESKPADAVRDLARAAKGVVDEAVPLPELTAKERKELGDSHREQVLREHRPVRNEKVQAKIRKIVDDLLRADGRKTKDFTVHVVQDPENNAYAFVGGNIIVNEGFLAFAGADDEMLHFVLGHEIGHVVKGHVDMPFRRQKLAGGLPGGSMAADAVNAVLANSAYSQSQEEDADCFAIGLLGKMKISTAGGVRFFSRIDRKPSDQDSGDGRTEDAKDDRPGDDGGKAVGALFGSHPDHDRRIELLTNGCDK